jgi:hypothetical protein
MMMTRMNDHADLLLPLLLLSCALHARHCHHPADATTTYDGRSASRRIILSTLFFSRRKMKTKKKKGELNKK